MFIQNTLATSVQHSSLSLEQIDAIENTLSSQLLLTTESAHYLTISILQSQASIIENSGLLIEPTDSIPYPLVLTNTGIFPIKKENIIGQGTYSKVYRVDMITTQSFHLGDKLLKIGDVEQVALKVWESNGQSSPTYSPEKRRLWSFIVPNQRGIDHYLTTFKIPTVAGFSVHKLYNCSLNHLNFDQLDNPVESLLQILKSAIEGLFFIHQHGGIHRDIKGGNILVSINDQKISGVLTDFTFVAAQFTQLHSTIGTSAFLDPTMFGSIEETLINQKNRKGIQTISGDIFAFGLTIVRYILTKFIIYKSNGSDHSDKINHIVKNLEPNIATGPFKDLFLQQIGVSNPYRVMYQHKSTETPEKLIIYPSLQVFRETLVSALEMLIDHLSPSELKSLIMLSHLSCDMQESNKKTRPNAGTVLKRLKEILTELKGKKRKLENPDKEGNVTKKSKFSLVFDEILSMETDYDENLDVKELV